MFWVAATDISRVSQLVLTVKQEENFPEQYFGAKSFFELLTANFLRLLLPLVVAKLSNFAAA